MALDESIPCKESSVSQSKAWRITRRRGTGERNYRVGLETDRWVSSEVQMVTQGNHEDVYSFFIFPGEWWKSYFEGVYTGRNVSLRRFFIEQNSLLLTKNKNLQSLEEFLASSGQ